MREAAVVMAVVTLAAAVTAGAAGAAPDRLAQVEEALAALDRGEGPTRSWVRTVDAGGVVEREATLEEARAALEEARRRLAADAGEPAVEPPEPVADVGFGAIVPDLPHQGCDAVATRLFALTGDYTPLSTYRLGRDNLIVEACGAEHGPFAEVLLDARPSLATCGTCATVDAQAWLEAPDGSTHVNDFVQVHHRGYGRLFETQLCWAAFCTAHAIFRGPVATAELLAEPVDLPVPPTHFPPK